MLTENQINALPERIFERLSQINTEYLESIGGVIKKIGELRPSDVHKLQQSYNYGEDVRKITKKLSDASGKNLQEIYEIFDIVAKENYSYAKPFYEARDIPFVPYEKNDDLRHYVKSLAKQTVDEYVNLTQHTAFAVFDKDGKSIAPLFASNKDKKSTSLSDTYTKIIDYAVTKVQLGQEGYQSAMREVIRAMSGSGIRTVDYATGYSRRLDTAVRQNILWGVKQCNQNTADYIGEEFGADGYEISYHSNPRPSHEEMGGKRFAKGKARTVKGVYYPSFELEAEPYLDDYGCLHFKFSILLGVSKSAYSEEQLAEFKANDKRSFEFDGDTYTMYEGTQLQGKIETAIRHQRDLSKMAKAAGNSELHREADAKIRQLTNKYHQLSKASGLPTRVERMQSAIKVVDKSSNRGIIKSGSEGMYRKTKAGKIEPMPKKQLHRIEKRFKSKGGIFLHDDTTDAYLRGKNAEAVTYDASTILLRKNPGRASVFEELIHATQYRNGENDGSYPSRLRCEIEAQRKLLRYSRSYGLTKEEVIQTQNALKAYEKELETYNKKGGV